MDSQADELLNGLLQERELARQLLDKYELRAKRCRHARNWLIFACIVLAIACGILLGTRRETSPDLPRARGLCLQQSDFSLSACGVDERPIPNDELSGGCDKNECSGVYADMEFNPEWIDRRIMSFYVRQFFQWNSSEIREVDLMLAPGFCLDNDVTVHESTESAKDRFTDLPAPRFGFDYFHEGIEGLEWDVEQVGDESRAWGGIERVDGYSPEEPDAGWITQYTVCVRFRKGPVISEVRAVIWGDDSRQVESFIVCVAKLSEDRISKALGET